MRIIRYILAFCIAISGTYIGLNILTKNTNIFWCGVITIWATAILLPSKEK